MGIAHKNLLLFGRIVLRDCRRRLTNLGMAYDFVPVIRESMEMFEVAVNVRIFMQRSFRSHQIKRTFVMLMWRGGIFQGNSLSPLLFVLSAISLS